MRAKTRHTVRDQAGFAVPTVMLMMVAALAIASAIAMASISSQHGSIRDQRTKLALAAAESGVNEALTRYNSVPTSNGQPCLLVSGGGSVVGSAAGSGGWCAAVGPGSSNGGTYTYQVKPTVDQSSHLTSHIEVVATGDVNGVTRRLRVEGDSAPGTQVFCQGGQTCYGVQTTNGINVNSNAQLHAPSATNGAITASGNAQICSNVSVGLGQQLVLNNNSHYYSDTGCTQSTTQYGQAQLTLPPFNQGDAATNNDNQRITNAVAGTGSPTDLVSGNRSNVSWNSTTRQLSISSNTTLTLTGSKYSLCRLVMSSNTALFVAADSASAIFFDSPEACGLTTTDQRTQLVMSSNSRISPSSGKPTKIAMYFVGSQTLQTWANFSSNTQAGTCESNFVVYAPLTDVVMNSLNSVYCGALASRSLQMDSNSKFYTDADSTGFTLAATGSHFTPNKFVDCSAALPSGQTTPDAGC